MIKSKEELLSAVKALLPDDSTNEALSLFEDLSDTLTGTNEENENWKQKYEENDKEWRERYRDRFFSGNKPESQDEPDEDDEPDKPEIKTFDDLFK